MSVIAHVYQRPIFKDNDVSARDDDPASTRSCRPLQKTTSNGNGPARSHPTIFPTSSPRFKSGKQMHDAFRAIYGRALNAASPGEAQRHGTLWTIKQWKRLAHYMVYVRCAAFFDTPPREFLMLIPMGRSEDIPLALRRREQREMKDKKSNVANFLEAQWVRGKALPRGNRRTPCKKAPNDCDHPPNAIQKGGNAVMYYERCEMCGNRWQRIPLTMVARDPETKLNNRTVLTSTGKRPVKIECSFLPTRTREHDDAGHTATEPRNALRAIPPQESAWTGAMFDL